MIEFERLMFSLKNVNCKKCFSIFLSRDTLRRKTCRLCSSNHKKEHVYYPVWFNDKQEIQYHVPTELKGLRVGEQLLIQKSSPYIPLVHVYNGTFGIQGHCVSFPQDIQDVCTKLPRLKCNVVRIIRSSVDTTSVANSHCNPFLIRRKKVIDALIWLKQYNILYKDISIDMNNLSWMKDNEESILPGVQDIYENSNAKQYNPSVSNHQTDMLDKQPDKDCLFGSVTQRAHRHFSKSDINIVETLKSSVKESKSKTRTISVMDFPQIQSDPNSEFDGTPIFAEAYPWLFPGGIGDPTQKKRKTPNTTSKDIKIHIWLEKLMRYHDNRFQLDKTFCFYANDFCQRRRANSNGHFFVKSICGQCPKSLDHLKQEIEEGNHSFVNKLQYWSGNLKGSDGYWRQKRQELNQWILYHLEQSNGPPTLFITLSCAEYWWPDLKRLLVDKLLSSQDDKQHKLAEQLLHDESNSRYKAIHMFTSLVQEFFHDRVQTWLDTVGKHILKIKHYWAAYEFAAGRGQIHIHLLAITSDQCQRLSEYYAYRKSKDCYEKRTELMAKYGREVLGLSADLPGIVKDKVSFIPISINNDVLEKRFSEVVDDVLDRQQLATAVQMHYCNDFCMKTPRGKKWLVCKLIV